ncbi:Collagen alpha-1(XXI) chain [Halotydeus destructor]|nr:Collagen alpha-1(XXI) chain [Halotydeus destructor]
MDFAFKSKLDKLLRSKGLLQSSSHACPSRQEIAEDDFANSDFLKSYGDDLRPAVLKYVRLFAENYVENEEEDDDSPAVIRKPTDAEIATFVQKWESFGQYRTIQNVDFTTYDFRNVPSGFGNDLDLPRMSHTVIKYIATNAVDQIKQYFLIKVPPWIVHHISAMTIRAHPNARDVSSRDDGTGHYYIAQAIYAEYKRQKALATWPVAKWLDEVRPNARITEDSTDFEDQTVKNAPTRRHRDHSALFINLLQTLSFEDSVKLMLQTTAKTDQVFFVNQVNRTLHQKGFRTTIKIQDKALFIKNMAQFLDNKLMKLPRTAKYARNLGYEGKATSPDSYRTLICVQVLHRAFNCGDIYSSSYQDKEHLVSLKFESSNNNPNQYLLDRKGRIFIQHFQTNCKALVSEFPLFAMFLYVTLDVEYDHPLLTLIDNEIMEYHIRPIEKPVEIFLNEIKTALHKEEQIIDDDSSSITATASECATSETVSPNEPPVDVDLGSIVATAIKYYVPEDPLASHSGNLYELASYLPTWIDDKVVAYITRDKEDVTLIRYGDQMPECEPIFQEDCIDAIVNYAINTGIKLNFFKLDLQQTLHKKFIAIEAGKSLILPPTDVVCIGNVVDLEVDWTLEPGQAGRDVVSAVLHKMEAAQLFSDDKRFLRRLAFVETRDGYKKHGQRGNIWNIDEAMLERTKNDSLANIHTHIETKFGINWTSTAYEDMTTPMLSGLAAYLNTETIDEEIPPEVDSQAVYWATHYSSATVEEFRSEERQFVFNFTNEFNLDFTRFGLVLYSTDPTVIFPVNGSRTREELNSLITNMQRINGATATGEAMIEGLKLLTEADKRDATQIMVVLTDGVSTDHLVVTASEQVAKSNISVYAVKVGNSWTWNPLPPYLLLLTGGPHVLLGAEFEGSYFAACCKVADPVEIQTPEKELRTITSNHQERVFYLSSFQQLSDSVSGLSWAICHQPIALDLTRSVSDTLARDEKRYYRIHVSDKGVTVSVEQSYGEVRAYYSETWERPSRAMNDGSINGSKTFNQLNRDRRHGLSSAHDIQYVITVVVEGNVVDLEVDWTLETGQAGRDVVSGVLLRMEAAQLFSDDKRFFRRLAFVETNDGFKKHGQRGNIWNIDEAMLERTKNDSLANIHNRIESIFGINWTSTTFDNMTTPMLSGLAAYLNTETIDEKIPPEVDSQAVYWASHYNSATADKFTSKVRQLRCHEPECNRHTDIVFIFDSSGSVERDQFEQARQFIYNFTNEFNLDFTRFGLVLYSTYPVVIFPVNGSRTREQLNSLIKNMQRIDGSTSTGVAMKEGLKLLTEADKRDSSQIMIVLTDGESADGLVATASEDVAKSNISAYAIGLGISRFSRHRHYYYNHQSPFGQELREPLERISLNYSHTATGLKELLTIANNHQERVFQLSNFQQLLDSIGELTLTICHQPIVLDGNRNVTDTLARDEKRYYKIGVSDKGITVSVKPIYGEVKAYYAETWERPSRAMNDGSINGSETFSRLNRNRRHGLSSSQDIQYAITVVVEGIHEQSEYQLITEEGGEEPLPTTTALPSSLSEKQSTDSTLPSKPSPALVSWLPDYMSSSAVTKRSADVSGATMNISVSANHFRRFFFSLGVQN